MAKAKKSTAQSETQSAGSEPKRSKMRLLGLAVTPIVLGVTSFATVSLLPKPGPVQAQPTDISASEHGGHAQFRPARAAHLVELAPIMVSTRLDGRQLRIGLVLETEMSHDDVSEHMPYLKDAFMGYLRAISVEAIQDPAYHSELRAQLLRRARLVLDGKVQGILITDFLVI